MAAAIPALLGLTVGEGVAFALGTALAPALRPLTQEYENAAWQEAVNLIGGDSLKPLGVGDLASIVAEAVESLGWGRDEAAKQGITQKDFDALFNANQTAPGFGTLLELLRRGLITQGAFEHGLRKAKMEGRWDAALEALQQNILSPGEIAAAIHRGLIPDPGLLQGEQPSPPYTVDAYPVYPIPPLQEAAGHGYDKERLGVLVGLQGLPMGVIEAAQAYFRGVITHGDYIRAFNESNNRNEWANAVLDYARQIPTARDYIENALRGYRTLAEAQKGAARHGMSAEDARLIFQNAGRPLNLHQITQAKAWGAKYNPLPGDDPDPYMNSVLIGSVTPAYYEMQDALKYNLPSAFFFRVLQQQNVLSEDEAVTWYKRLGWPPELAEKVAAAWAKGTGATADPHVAKAQTQLWGTLHRAYMAGDASEATVRTMLPHAGVSANGINGVVTAWNHERELQRQRITPAQLKKAYAKAVQNPLTGAPWTYDEVLAELLSRGWSTQDANTFLNTPSGQA